MKFVEEMQKCRGQFGKLVSEVGEEFSSMLVTLFLVESLILLESSRSAVQNLLQVFTSVGENC